MFVFQYGYARMHLFKPCSQLFVLLITFSVCAEPLPEFIEGMVPSYRKVSLAGRHFPGPMPQDRDRSDSEPEETFVDVMTLQLQHRTSDVYITVGSADLAITVNRNVEDAVWVEGEGLAPAQRPDLPFGNCWSSGLAANLHQIHRGNTFPEEALVRDEEGTIHRFVKYLQDGKTTYIPMPHSRSQQDFQMTSLEKLDSGHYLFKKKFGTRLTFAVQPTVKLFAEREGVREQHIYHRLNKVADRFDATINYHYDESNGGLIPDQLAYHDQVVIIHKNPKGRISRIIDPAGFLQLYRYREPKQKGGAPLLLDHRKPITDKKRAKTRMEYDQYSETNSRGANIHYCNVSLIESRHDRTYRFSYAKESSGSRHGPGRDLKEVELPGEFGTVQFIPHSDLNKQIRRTFVKDPEGNGIFYEFTKNKIEDLKIGDKLLARFAIYGEQITTYFEGQNYELGKTIEAGEGTKILGSERYTFQMNAGGAVSEAFTMREHSFRFTYPERNRSRDLTADITHPFATYYGDPAIYTFPLGEATRYTYSKRYRLPVKIIDPAGKITINEVTTPREVIISTRTYANKQDFENNVPFTRMDSEFENKSHPGFATRTIVGKTSKSPEKVSWEVDLVKVYTPDKQGRTIKTEEDPEGLKYFTRRVYDDNSNLRSKIFSNGYRIDFKYDGRNRLKSVFRPSDGAPSTSRTDYNLVGDETLEFETNGSVYSYEHDGMGRETLRISYEPGNYPDRPGVKTETRSNSAGSTVWGIDEEEDEYTIGYDGLQRAISINYVDGPIITYQYVNNCGDNLFSSSSFNITREEHSGKDFISLHKYDKNGRIVSSSEVSKGDAKEKSRKDFSYDPAGNHTETESSEGITVFNYDVVDRLIRTDFPNGQHSRVLYTSTSLKYATVDPDGNRDEEEFDASGEPVNK